jgi:hypothetical protein
MFGVKESIPAKNQTVCLPSNLATVRYITGEELEELVSNLYLDIHPTSINEMSNVKSSASIS